MSLERYNTEEYPKNVNELIVKIFVSDDCPRCIPAKEWYNLLVKEFGSMPGGSIGKHKIELYNKEHQEDIPQFLFYAVLSLPAVIICDSEGNEQYRFIGPDKLKDARRFL